MPLVPNKANSHAATSAIAARRPQDRGHRPTIVHPLPGPTKISATSHSTRVATSSSPVPKTFGIWPWRPDGSGLPPGKQNAKSLSAPAAESPNAQQNQFSHHPRYLLNSQGFHQPTPCLPQSPICAARSMRPWRQLCELAIVSGRTAFSSGGLYAAAVEPVGCGWLCEQPMR